MDNYLRTRIKLEAFDSKLLTTVCKNLTEEILSVNGIIKGPIPLPTQKRIYCVLRSPHVDKKSREHFEIRIHKRLLDLYLPQTKIGLKDYIVTIPIPPGVSIKLY